MPEAPATTPVNGSTAAAKPASEAKAVLPPGVAATGAGSAAAVEPPKETPQEGKLLAQIRAREKHLVEEQQRNRRELEQERARISAEKREMEQWRAQRAADESARAERERAELGQKDPLRWFQREQQEKLSAQDEKIRQLESKLMAQEQQSMSLRQQEAVDRELKGITDMAKASSDRPHVAKYASAADGKLRASVIRVAREHLEQGVRLTNDEILDKLEEELALEASIWTDSGKPRDSASDKSPSGSTQSSAEQTKPAQTLTNARAGERAAEISPEELAKLSLPERRARTLAKLQELRAARTAAAGK